LLRLPVPRVRRNVLVLLRQRLGTVIAALQPVPLAASVAALAAGGGWPRLRYAPDAVRVALVAGERPEPALA
jgi:hypothetical protein